MAARKLISSGICRAVKKLPGAKKSLHHVCRFYNITAIVLLTKRNGCAGRAIYPMRECAMIAGNFIRKKIYNGINAGKRFRLSK